MYTEWPKFEHPWVREERAPVYVFNYPHTATKFAIHEFYDRMTQFYMALSSPIACVALVNNIDKLDASDCLLVARRERVLAPFQQKFLRGTALVVDSPLRRGLIAAVFGAAPPNYRWKAFADYEQACFWAHSQLYSVRPQKQTRDP